MFLVGQSQSYFFNGWDINTSIFITPGNLLCLQLC